LNFSNLTSFWRHCRGVGAFQYRGLFEYSRLGHLKKIPKNSKIFKIKKKTNLTMATFHFSQFKHEYFWQYLSRLNDYRGQYAHSMYEKMGNMRCCA